MHSVCHRYDDDHSLTGHKKFSWDNRVITPTLFKVCIPLNYDNPLGKGLLFVLNDFSEMESTKLWNDCDRKGYEGYVAKRGALEDSDPTVVCNICQPLALASMRNLRLSFSSSSFSRFGIEKRISSSILILAGLLYCRCC